jgi:acyl-CoA oxidase
MPLHFLEYDQTTHNLCLLEFTIEDVLSLTTKYWEMHKDPMASIDGAAMTICTIQINLAAGTIAQHAVHRPEFVPIVEDLLQFKKQCVVVSHNFC